MRVLFSADWHLGYELGGSSPQSRLPDQERQLRLIARYIEEHRVDVLAIAGDVFEAQDRGTARAAVAAMTRALKEPLERGLIVVAIAGNHDRDYFMETANAWLAAGVGGGSPGVVLRTRPDLVTVAAGNERVNFALMPYPTPNRYDLPPEDRGGLAQQNQHLARLFVEHLQAFQQQTRRDGLPVVLLAHLVVEGTRERAHRISPHDDITVPLGPIPNFELTVIGHIHKPGPVGADNAYYVGGLDRMDIGEQDYENRVLLADIGPHGVRDVTSLPLDPTPFARVTASSEEDLHAAAGQVADRERTLVQLRLEVPYGTFTQPLIAAAQRLFPRLYGNTEHVWLGAPGPQGRIQGVDHRDVMATLRRYLEVQVPDEAEREELLDLAGRLRAGEAV